MTHGTNDRITAVRSHLHVDWEAVEAGERVTYELLVVPLILVVLNYPPDLGRYSKHFNHVEAIVKSVLMMQPEQAISINYVKKRSLH